MQSPHFRQENERASLAQKSKEYTGYHRLRLSKTYNIDSDLSNAFISIRRPWLNVSIALNKTRINKTRICTEAIIESGPFVLNISACDRQKTSREFICNGQLFWRNDALLNIFCNQYILLNIRNPCSYHKISYCRTWLWDMAVTVGNAISMF